MAATFAVIGGALGVSGAAAPWVGALATSAAGAGLGAALSPDDRGKGALMGAIGAPLAVGGAGLGLGAMGVGPAAGLFGGGGAPVSALAPGLTPGLNPSLGHPLGGAGIGFGGPGGNFGGAFSNPLASSPIGQITPNAPGIIPGTGGGAGHVATGQLPGGAGIGEIFSQAPSGVTGGTGGGGGGVSGAQGPTGRQQFFDALDSFLSSTGSSLVEENRPRFFEQQRVFPQRLDEDDSGLQFLAAAVGRASQAPGLNF